MCSAPGSNTLIFVARWRALPAKHGAETILIENAGPSIGTPAGSLGANTPPGNAAPHRSEGRRGARWSTWWRSPPRSKLDTSFCDQPQDAKALGLTVPPSLLLKVIHFDQTFAGKVLNMPHHRLGPMPGVGG